MTGLNMLNKSKPDLLKMANEAVLFDPKKPWDYCDAITQGREGHYLLQRPIVGGDTTIACSLCRVEHPEEAATAPVVHWQYFIEESDLPLPRLSRMRLCQAHLRSYVEALQEQLATIEEG